MISRGFAWIDDTIEHSEADEARATALAKKWSALQSDEELRRMETIEDGRDADYPAPAWERKQAERQAERSLEIELIEDKLNAIGARMMRPYEHWNEAEPYMEYMETRYDHGY